MKPQTPSVFAALADPTREAIVRLLIDQESSVGDIAEQLPVSRPAVSKHLRLLQGCGLVSMRSVGFRAPRARHGALVNVQGASCGGADAVDGVVEGRVGSTELGHAPRPAPPLGHDAWGEVLQRWAAVAAKERSQ